MIKDAIFSIVKGIVRKTNKAQWHNLRSTNPVSSKFGFERGTPIDRYYIEKFLDQNKSAIKGIVLEIASSDYSHQFGSDVSKFEVLHADKNFKGVTILGDLSDPGSLPVNAVDCFICTQTLNFIFDLSSAVESCYNVLKPGGVLLITVCGLSQISAFDYEQWGDYWRLTDMSLKKLLLQKFPQANIQLDVFGNVLAATSLLHGISSEELSKEELDFRDKNYQIIVAAKVVKPQ